MSDGSNINKTFLWVCVWVQSLLNDQEPEMGWAMEAD